MTLRERTAARLAATAAASAYFYRRVADVIIGPDGTDKAYRPVPDRSKGDYPTLFIGLAGSEGESALCGDTFSGPRSNGDGRVAYSECLRLTSDDGPRAAALLYETREKVKDWVRTFGDVISRLAAELDRRGAMRGQDIEQALHHALDEDRSFADRPSVPAPPAPPDVWGKPMTDTKPVEYSRQPTRHDLTRYRVCVHEAGHAIASIHRGHKVHSVVIAEQPGQHSGCETSESIYSDPRGRCVILAAGPASERLICGPSGSERINHEFDQAHAWGTATHYCNDNAQSAARMIGDARRDAETFAREHLPTISALANELFHRGTMTGEQIESFLNGAR